MSKPQRAQNIIDQHAQLRKLIDRFEANEHLPLSSDMAHELMDKLLYLIVQNIKAECKLLKESCNSLDPFYSHNKHADSIPTELININFELMSRSNKTIATILPQIRNLID
ncbi:MAG: hypothetical protein NTY41_18155, partial [Proteobacteria bacterium]|nr:hypothetical protein [Pseudomonadota bacterium]